MPPYLAVFFHSSGTPLSLGLYTIDEFIARCRAAADKQELSWAILLASSTGRVVHGFNSPRPSYAETA